MAEPASDVRARDATALMYGSFALGGLAGVTIGEPGAYVMAVAAAALAIVAALPWRYR